MESRVVQFTALHSVNKGDLFYVESVDAVLCNVMLSKAEVYCKKLTVIAYNFDLP